MSCCCSSSPSPKSTGEEHLALADIRLEGRETRKFGHHHIEKVLGDFNRKR